MEHLLSERDVEKRRLWRIIIKYVGDSADCVQDKLFILVDISAVNGLADLLDELAEQLFHTFESFESELLLR